MEQTITYVYSGGSDNSTPSQSVGGPPSSFPIAAGLDNLFPDVTSDQAAAGYTDLRCLYVFNDLVSTSFRNAQIFVNYVVSNGTSVVLGFMSQDDIQALTVLGSPTGGSVTIQYETYQCVVNYDPDPTNFAANLQGGLNGLGYLSTVLCSGYVDNGAITVRMVFQGADGNRYHPLITVLNNSISGSTGVVVTKLQDGSPVNAMAPPAAPPSGVLFNNIGINNAYTIISLYPGDGVPVWVRRYTPPGTSGLRGDGFVLRFTGQAISVTIPVSDPTFSYSFVGGLNVSGSGSSELIPPGHFYIGMNGYISLFGIADYKTIIDGHMYIYTSMRGRILVVGDADESARYNYSYDTTGIIIITD